MVTAKDNWQTLAFPGHSANTPKPKLTWYSGRSHHSQIRHGRTSYSLVGAEFGAPFFQSANNKSAQFPHYHPGEGEMPPHPVLKARCLECIQHFTVKTR